MSTASLLTEGSNTATSSKQHADAFIEKWAVGGRAARLGERAGAQAHFIDLCSVLGVNPPDDPDNYCFERGFRGVVGGRGFADVWKRGYFAWEYKAPRGSLDAALVQLVQYALPLDNPPLLVVSDRLRIEIHTHFTGHPSEKTVFSIDELTSEEVRQTLRAIFLSPDRFRPRQSNRDITEQAAASFATIADRLRLKGVDARAAAHFLTQCVFCLFAEGVGLLRDNVFRRVLQGTASNILPAKLTRLFEVMKTGGPYGADDIDWFNGGLFNEIAVPDLTLDDTFELANAASLNWKAIDPSIFGTLFERGLDPDKRAQLGAHYTDPSTILRLVEPTIKVPLLAEWERTKPKIAAALSRRDYLRARAKGIPSTSKRLLDRYARIRSQANDAQKSAQALFGNYLEQLKAFTVLDPACGSGNFLFIALKCIKDVEHLVNVQAEELGLQRQLPVTGPHNVRGIEINAFAAELARVTVWIGELQWMIEHGRDCEKNPILRSLNHIENRDALLSGIGAEAKWPVASVVVGNPPFLGDKKMRAELGAEYTERLRSVYSDRVPGSADLVTYWFEKARAEIENHGLGAAGLVATNSIRQVANRKVLERIARTTRIFEAWSDEPWVNDGAAVRVSLICFGAAERTRLDGKDVDSIHVDLSAGGSGVDLTQVQPLLENQDACFFGLSLAGAFTVPGEIARRWLCTDGNPNGRPNTDVLRPILNGADITTRRQRDRWVIDFGLMGLEDARLYEAPFDYVNRVVRPERQKNNRESRAKYWWRHGEARPAMRQALANMQRFIATSETSKHRFFVWCPSSVAPEHKLVVFPRDDDATFGILSSRIHVCWALSMGSTLEDRPVYTTSRVLETFPFPPGMELNRAAHESKNPHKASIEQAAKRLHEIREAWLTPLNWVDLVPEEVQPSPGSAYPPRIVPKLGRAQDIGSRTMTELYNQRPTWLTAAHLAVDSAVAAAYGWTDYGPDMPDQVILTRLVTLNHVRAGPRAQSQLF